MFCAFEAPPRIVRFHGKGEVLESDHKEFAAVSRAFGEVSDSERFATRAFVRIHVSRISDSCGYSVPLYDYKGDRDILLKWNENKGPEAVKEYQRQKNRKSIDGLTGLNS